MSGQHRFLLRQCSGFPRAVVAIPVVFLANVAFLLAVCALPVGGADKVAVVDTRVVVEAYYAIMAGPGLDPKTPVGPDPQEVRKVEKELDGLKAQYARERASLSPEAKGAFEKGLLEKTAALQALYAKKTRDMVDVVKWRSPDVLITRLKAQIQEYGREQGFALILEKQTGGALFQREGWSGPSSDPIDVTQPLIEWLRRKEESARPPKPTPPSSGR